MKTGLAGGKGGGDTGGPGFHLKLTCDVKYALACSEMAREDSRNDL